MYAHISSQYPAAFTPYGRLAIDGAGLPLIAPADKSTPPHDDRSMALVFRDGRMLKHYFHFLEILLGAYFLQREYFGDYRVTRLYVGHQQWNNARQNFVQSKMIQALYPGLEIVEGADGVGTAVSNALTMDRQRVHTTPTIINTMNKFLESFGTIGVKWAPSFRSRIWSAAGVAHDQDQSGIRAGYVSRRPPRMLAPDAERRMCECLRRRGAEPHELDYATMSWEQQVSSTAAVNLLYGVHGNGLTNLVWLKPGSVVLEFFPENVHHYDYQNLSEIFSHGYFGFEGKHAGGGVWRDFSRSGPPRGEANAPVTDLPWPLLETCLEAGMARCRQG